MRRLKIGIITHNFPNSISDRQNAGIFVYDFARALSSKADVFVFSPGRDDCIKNIGGIKTHFFRFEKKLGNLKVYNPLHLLRFVNFFIKGKRALREFGHYNNYLDFVISMWAFPGGFFASRLFKNQQIPYAVYCLGSDIYIYAKKPLLKNLIKKYLQEATLRLADSPDLSDKVKALSGKDCLFVPSASDFVSKTRHRPISNSKKIVLTYLGRLEYVKGIDIFVNALRLLGPRIQKLAVNIVGGGSLEDLVKEKTKDIKQVKFFGNLHNKNKIAQIMQNSNWLVIPSRSDSIPLVFSEAMKNSLPVIVSDLPDMKYLINKYKVGVTFKVGSEIDLSKTIEDIIQGKVLDKNFRINTKKAAEIFDLKKSSTMLLNLIRKNI